jgi:hypothetical protein
VVRCPTVLEILDFTVLKVETPVQQELGDNNKVINNSGYTNNSWEANYSKEATKAGKPATRETTGTAGDANNRTGTAGDAINRTGTAGEAKNSFNPKTSGNVRRVVNNIKDATAGVPGRVATERTT